MTTSAAAADFVMPFGRHKGQPLSAVPAGYLTWALVAVTGMYPETRAAIEAYLGRPSAPPAAEGAPAERPASRRPRARSAPRAEATAAAATCATCGLAGTTDRPLVHATCASDPVPF